MKTLSTNKHTDRTGLYIIVLLIWMSSCDTNNKVERLFDKLCVAPQDQTCPRVVQPPVPVHP